MGLALLLSGLVLPYFNQLAGKQLPYPILFGRSALVVTLLLAAVVSICAGMYPALVLSRGKSFPS
jgi:putative ABC transport system permease protein